MRFLGDPCCASCGVPFDRDEGEGARCGACLADSPPWTSARAAIGYGDISGAVAMRLKYGRRTGLARLMARHMAHRVHPDVRTAGKAALIVPVPLHRWRLWSRGFNQSALVAGHIARALDIPADPFVLRRVRATRPLRELGPRERHRTVARAFAIDPKRAGALDGRTVLLIDDVHTSGATARACARTLMAGGAHAVHLLCWARVLNDGPGN
jgi:ComF family protein